MFKLENVSFLFFFSLAAMLLAFISAIFHGLARNGCLKERIFEYLRNAMVQFSAMLFALAVAQYVFQRNIYANEKSTARAAIADRLSRADRAMLRFDFKNKPGLTPECLDKEQPTEYDVIFSEYKLDNDCLLQISISMNKFILNFQQTEIEMKKLGEALRVSEDWVKSPYFSKTIGIDVLHDFQSIEEKIDYRLFVVHQVFEKLKSRIPTSEPRYDDIKALSYADLSINYFQKSSLIYLIMFCETFGDPNATKEEIAGKEKKFYASVKGPGQNNPRFTNSANDMKSMLLTNFKQILLDNARDCQFEGETCELILDHLPIDRDLLTP